MKILIIEDEPELSLDMSRFLSTQQYRCELAQTFPEAEEKIGLYQYDCILLDLMLPGGNGLDLIQPIQTMQAQAGLIILSAKGSIEDKIEGLKKGADDYLAKPFHLAELGARVFSVLRRKQFGARNTLEIGPLRIQPEARTAFVGEQALLLTRSEFDLMLFFIANANRTLSKEMIAENLHGDLADQIDRFDFVYAHVKNLKKKLADAGMDPPIKTVYATGYLWKAQ